MSEKFVKTLQKRSRDLGVELTNAQARIFFSYGEMLAEANHTTNLTAISKEDYINEHFVDSLTLIGTEKITDRARVADIGAGAGFPGLAVKIVKPIDLYLIESNAKKSMFLEKLIDELGIDGAKVIKARAEMVGRDADIREKMDVVIARAVAGLPVLLEYALPLLRTGGWFLAMKGSRFKEELKQAQSVCLELGARVDSVFEPRGADAQEGRVIIQIQKTEKTKNRYPRRTGVPTKRPLGD